MFIFVKLGGIQIPLRYLYLKESFYFYNIFLSCASFNFFDMPPMACSSTFSID